MKKFTLNLKMCVYLIICLISMAFSTYTELDEQTTYIQKLLTDHYDDELETSQIMRYELNVTNSGFFRYKRFLKTGKVEYFSFNLIKFKNIDYYGSDKSGKLFLRTKSDDVIVQTYEDREGGDIDTMADYMSIPLKNIAPQDLADLSEKLTRMNALLLAQK